MGKETVRVAAWLNQYKRKQFISIYEYLKEKYILISEILFVDHELSTKKYAERLEEKYGTVFNWEVTDPGDVYELILEEATQFYHYEVLMEHNHHLMMLSNMYQIFEQQPRQFIYSELNHHTNPIRTNDLKDFGNNLNEIKEAYSLVGYDLNRNSQWEKIKTLHDIVNTFKHGMGRSASRLLKKHPELFLEDKFTGLLVIDLEQTTNFEVIFDIKKIDFNFYADGIIAFWNEVPEHLEGYYTFE